MDLYAFFKKKKMVNGVPAFLSFRKEQIINNWIPCRKISGDSIDMINEFIRASLQ